MPLLASTLGLTQPEYGYVLAVGVSSALVNVWHGILVSTARKEAKISYPTAYASTEQADKDPVSKRFNCTQRAHGNYLENLPNFLILLGTAGLRYPVYASVAGAIWLAGRVVYALGYSTGDPAQRQKGVFQYIGLLSLLGMSGMTCYKMIVGDF
ncbi:Putative uncharacterized protein [Taphrina deformans PYCC 5710]|uniref:Glutathione S-transferase 3, mitochondrial n=1 Tax=Taphrina deformans (strain PYCC 5710 / ATCC 11124 / CBS 356.35 / IMI 108563 / JCM 9778 / NBRC 8474) TaxID=1097556 RepID=R4X9C4_TAPDE|nr:Putative uncharacterized protein [Taphrina deformans PYCC 5710]|eukprot:CCG82295.1 Putative uncharacterized protein [Taphrina deformans PYCC 5710]